MSLFSHRGLCVCTRKSAILQEALGLLWQIVGKKIKLGGVGGFFCVSGCLSLLRGGSGGLEMGLLSGWQRLMPWSVEGHKLCWMSRAADSGR